MYYCYYHRYDCIFSLFILIKVINAACNSRLFLAANTHLISVSFHLYIVSLRFSSVGLIIYEMFKQEVRSYLNYFSLFLHFIKLIKLMKPFFVVDVELTIKTF